MVSHLPWSPHRGGEYVPAMTDLPADALHVVATLPTDPASAEEVRAALVKLGAATLGEEGCYAYDVYESQSTPGVFVTVEAWRGQADLDAHMKTPHIAEAFTVLGDALTDKVAVHPLTPVR